MLYSVQKLSERSLSQINFSKIRKDFSKDRHIRNPPRLRREMRICQSVNRKKHRYATETAVLSLQEAHDVGSTAVAEVLLDWSEEMDTWKLEELTHLTHFSVNPEMNLSKGFRAITMFSTFPCSLCLTISNDFISFSSQNLVMRCSETSLPSSPLLITFFCNSPVCFQECLWIV